MQNAIRDLTLAVLILACVGLAFVVQWRHTTTHTAVDDYLAGGALLVAVGLAIPMRLAALVQAIKPVLPWVHEDHHEEPPK